MCKIKYDKREEETPCGPCPDAPPNLNIANQTAMEIMLIANGCRDGYGALNWNQVESIARGMGYTDTEYVELLLKLREPEQLTQKAASEDAEKKARKRKRKAELREGMGAHKTRTIGSGHG